MDHSAPLALKHMDSIVINDLEVFYRVGVPDEERASAQRLLITVEMERDFQRAAATDDLHQTIDYFAVSQRIIKLGESRSRKLIESVAVQIAEMIKRDFKAMAVTVEVKKFIIPQTRYVSVKVRR